MALPSQLQASLTAAGDLATQATKYVPATLKTLRAELAAARSKWNGLAATLTGWLPFGDDASQSAVLKNLDADEKRIGELDTRGQALMVGQPITLDSGQLDSLASWSALAKVILDEIKYDAKLEDQSDVTTIVADTVKATAHDVKHGVETGLSFWGKWGGWISTGLLVGVGAIVLWPVALFLMGRRRRTA